MFNEAELKRCLVRSLRAQGGEGHRAEDKYRIGVPDLYMLPQNMPGGWYEAKIIRGAKLVCTASQERWLERYHKPPWSLAAVIGWAPKRNALYIGWPETPLSACRYIPRPSALHSTQWWISELLGKWYHDARLDVRRSPTYVTQGNTGDTDAQTESRAHKRRDGPHQPALHAAADEVSRRGIEADRPRHDGDRPPRRGRVPRIPQ
jgi:hypothetical protein